jgi:hypothetical protein
VSINENKTEQNRVNVSAEQAGWTVLDNSSANIDKCNVYGIIDVSEFYLVTDVPDPGANARIFWRQ